MTAATHSRGHRYDATVKLYVIRPSGIDIGHAGAVGQDGARSRRPQQVALIMPNTEPTRKPKRRPVYCISNAAGKTDSETRPVTITAAGRN